MDTIRPLADSVVVERAPAAERTSGGLVLPETAREKPREGTVLAAGPGWVLASGERRPLEVRAGDRILFEPSAGREVELAGRGYLILKEQEILAVLAA